MSKASKKLRKLKDQLDKLEEKVEEVKPIIIGSEKSDHNSKINIEKIPEIAVSKLVKI